MSEKKGTNMDIERINEEFGRRFASPLPEFHTRRLIFWYDEDREFEDRLDEIDVPGVKLLKLTGSNMFAAKHLLVTEDPDSNYIVYVPLVFAKPDENWLLNLEIISGEPFRADICAIWVEEMGLAQTQMLHQMVKKYRKFFNNAQRRYRFSRYAKNVTNETQFHVAVMASICNCDDEPMEVIRAVLQCGDSPELNLTYKDFVTYGCSNPFWEMVKQGTGYVGDNLTDLMQTVFITAAAWHADCFTGLERFNNTSKSARCYDLMSEWLKDDGNLYEDSRKVEDDLRLRQRFMTTDIGILTGIECFPCVNEVILTRLMEDISNGIIDTNLIRKTIERRRTCKWYDRFELYYDGLMQVSQMQEFLNRSEGRWHETQPDIVWKEYVNGDYMMDTWYRLFHVSFSQSLLEQNYGLGDLFKKVADVVENMYSRYLSELGSCWTAAEAEDMAKRGSVRSVPRQVDFYRNHMAVSEGRTFVIISDALRFEVGASLAAELRRTQGKTTLSSMCSVFPSVTPFGMAALLPHKEMTVELKKDKLSVLCDGMSTEASDRDAVLKAANLKSIALKYDEIMKLRMEEKRALVKGMEVIYIYHDRIDAAGHGSDSVFSACKKAIEEIMGLVRAITNELGGTRVLITADHGFLYTARPLAEDERLSKENWNGMDVENGRRHVIMEKGAKPAYMMPVRFLDDRYDAFAPMDNIRIRMQGGGDQFVHGGASLQEMVVPLVEYKYVRNASAEYQNNRDQYDVKPVTLELASSVRKTSNKSFFLNFFQREAVDDRHEATKYIVRFENAAGTTISDTVEIIADRKTENRQERTYRCQFNLKDLAYDSHETYYLVIADKDGLQIPQRLEFVIDIAFATDDFNFFG